MLFSTARKKVTPGGAGMNEVQQKEASHERKVICSSPIVSERGGGRKCGRCLSSGSMWFYTFSQTVIRRDIGVRKGWVLVATTIDINDISPCVRELLRMNGS